MSATALSVIFMSATASSVIFMSAASSVIFMSAASSVIFIVASVISPGTISLHLSGFADSHDNLLFHVPQCFDHLGLLAFSTQRKNMKHTFVSCLRASHFTNHVNNVTISMNDVTESFVCMTAKHKSCGPSRNVDYLGCENFLVSCCFARRIRVLAQWYSIDHIIWCIRRRWRWWSGVGQVSRFNYWTVVHVLWTSRSRRHLVWKFGKV